VSGKEIGGVCCLLVWGLKFLPQLNIKAVHNLKTKSLGIILIPWAVFVPIAAFLLFLAYDVACGE